MESFHDYLKLKDPEMASALDYVLNSDERAELNAHAESWAAERYGKPDPAQLNLPIDHTR